MFVFLFVRKEVFWEAERQVKIHKRNLFCFFSKRFGVRERRSPGIFSLNRDKIKEEEEEQYQARLFSWQHHSAGTKREKEKRFRTRTWRYSSRDENKRRKKTNHQQQQHHTDTHVLVFYYMPVFFQRRKIFSTTKSAPCGRRCCTIVSEWGHLSSCGATHTSRSSSSNGNGRNNFFILFCSLFSKKFILPSCLSLSLHISPPIPLYSLVHALLGSFCVT